MEVDIDEKAVEQVVSLRVRNACASEIPLYLEPWGEEYKMAPGTVFTIVMQGPVGDSLEAEIADDHVAVWGWSGAVASVLQGGIELRTGIKTPLVVPTPRHQQR